MTWKSRIAELFAEQEIDENFTEAKTQLSRLKNKITNVSVIIDNKQSNLVFIKNKWQVMPQDMGTNIRFIALQTEENYNLVLCDLNETSSIFNHSHTKNYEVIRVIDGAVNLTYNGKTTTLTTGDEIKMDFNKDHSIEGISEARILIAYSPKKKNAVIYNESILLAEKFEKKI